MIRTFVRAAALLAALAVTPVVAAPAAASSMPGGEAPTFTVEQTASFAKQVERLLAERGARVALVARIGRDPDDLPDGVEYTHVGLWVHSRITTADGRQIPGYAVFNLYQSAQDPDRSSLVQDYPLDFFAEVFEQRAGVLIPTPQMQARLARLIASPAYAALHDPRYSLLANPHQDRYQNCTSFVLDLSLAAIYGTTDRAQLRANARAWFQPATIDVDPLRRLLGPLFVGGVHTDDHDGAIATATFGSLVQFYQSYGLAAQVLEVTPQDTRGHPVAAAAD